MFPYLPFSLWPPSENDIKSRAAACSQEWAGEAQEHADAKSFWDGLFQIFGIPRRRIATFERVVQKANARTGFINLLWKGTFMVKHFRPKAATRKRLFLKESHTKQQLPVSMATFFKDLLFLQKTGGRKKERLRPLL